MKLTKTHYFFIVLFALIVLIHGGGFILHVADATFGARRAQLTEQGRDVLEFIKQDQSLWDAWTTDNGITNFTSSTDLVNAMNKFLGKPLLSPDRNVWNVAKNLPKDAPDNFIVLATRNIDPNSLRVSLTEDQMDNTLVFLQEEMKGILKHLFIVIRKDKLSFNYRCNTNSPYTSLRHVYDNKPFDITTNLTNNLPMIYLTPDGEISTQEN